jgi:hypothetical protein
MVAASTPATLEDIEIAFCCMIVGGPLLLAGVSSLIAAVIFWLAEAFATRKTMIQDTDNRHRSTDNKA